MELHFFCWLCVFECFVVGISGRNCIKCVSFDLGCLVVSVDLNEIGMGSWLFVQYMQWCGGKSWGL